MEALGVLLAFVVLAPRDVPRQEVERLEARLDAARHAVEAAFGPLGADDVEVVLCATSVEFQDRSGRTRREAAAARDRRLYLQPLTVLRRLRDLDQVLRHELGHLLIDHRFRRCAAPPSRAVHEGLAQLVAGEAALDAEPMTEAAIVRSLEQPRDEVERARAYRAARRLVDARGGKRLLEGCR